MGASYFTAEHGTLEVTNKRLAMVWYCLLSAAWTGQICAVCGCACKHLSLWQDALIHLPVLWLIQLKIYE